MIGSINNAFHTSYDSISKADDLGMAFLSCIQDYRIENFKELLNEDIPEIYLDQGIEECLFQFNALKKTMLKILMKEKNLFDNVLGKIDKYSTHEVLNEIIDRENLQDYSKEFLSNAFLIICKTKNYTNNSLLKAIVNSQCAEEFEKETINNGLANCYKNEDDVYVNTILTSKVRAKTYISHSSFKTAYLNQTAFKLTWERIKELNGCDEYFQKLMYDLREYSGQIVDLFNVAADDISNESLKELFKLSLVNDRTFLLERILDSGKLSNLDPEIISDIFYISSVALQLRALDLFLSYKAAECVTVKHLRFLCGFLSINKGNTEISDKHLYNTFSKIMKLPRAQDFKKEELDFFIENAEKKSWHPIIKAIKDSALWENYSRS